jgi:hypothetical protein
MRRLVFLALAATSVAVGTTHHAPAQITLDANFDYGSLKSYGVSGNIINLQGRTNYSGSGNTGKWRWMYFKATGVVGATPLFSINQNFGGDQTPGPHELRDHEMVYSYDNENWSFFDNNQLVSTNTDLFQFSNSTPFTQNTVYVAYAIPYSYGRSVAHTQAALASPWAEPTYSATAYKAANPSAADGVIGQSFPGTDDNVVPRSIPALDVFAYRITNPATDSPDNPKHKIGITTGLHAGEPLGTYVFEGLINWLVSDDPRAARLRDVAEVFAYPVLNPSGRYAGMNRATVANPTRDPNSPLWSAANWSSSTYGCGSDHCREIRVTGQAMAADVFHDTPAGLDAFIDFHSTVPDYTGDGVYNTGEENAPLDFGYIDIAGGKANAAWWQNFRTLEPDTYQWQGSTSCCTTTGYARNSLGAAVDVTFETQFSWERNIDFYHNEGKNFGVAFYQAWVPQVDGDFTGDGLVDGRDYIVWRTTVGQTGSALQADANHDNIVDVNDYNIWRSHFGQIADSGSLLPSTGQATVPEPAALTLLTLAMVARCPRRRRALLQDLGKSLVG